ncbi:hypothetical protein KUM_0588 [Taylorella asinigenitalis 14/45]|uniref:Bacterial CdiA-CT RNAse A domain-containing protein n=1 Tax=Taylorella asinigenitalis 14/45 TaxID=1091495 RepID=I7IBU0_9BURK|nr:contact-dependent growth inhibition system immunity protein [Taylorella asinigenitalis]CCG19385.1 hypothetical protein KUM_0588 [Taylorella asinigenitalis 14/45]
MKTYSLYESSFNSYDEQEKLQIAALAANDEKIQKWLKLNENQLLYIEYRDFKNVGTVQRKPENQSLLTNLACFILKKDSNESKGYRVINSYPIMGNEFELFSSGSFFKKSLNEQVDGLEDIYSQDFPYLYNLLKSYLNKNYKQFTNSDELEDLVGKYIDNISESEKQKLDHEIEEFQKKYKGIEDAKFLELFNPEIYIESPKDFLEMLHRTINNLGSKVDGIVNTISDRLKDLDIDLSSDGISIGKTREISKSKSMGFSKTFTLTDIINFFRGKNKKD